MTWDQFEKLWQALWAYLYKVLEHFGYVAEEDAE